MVMALDSYQSLLGQEGGNALQSKTKQISSVYNCIYIYILYTYVCDMICIKTTVIMIKYRYT